MRIWYNSGQFLAYNNCSWSQDGCHSSNITSTFVAGKESRDDVNLISMIETSPPSAVETVISFSIWEYSVRDDTQLFFSTSFLLNLPLWGYCSSAYSLLQEAFPDHWKLRTTSTLTGTNGEHLQLTISVEREGVEVASSSWHFPLGPLKETCWYDVY